ncbi:MAG: serine/threonine-protein kinase, partial [Chloroflexota bacterium]
MIEDNQIGKVIKSYELQGLVGTGGFGAVYRATQDVIDREVAIKIIWPAFANHPNFIKRFEAEAQLVAGLEHPYIVPLYDYWRDPDGAYIVMRFLRGGALRDVIDGKKWSLNDLNRLVNQVGSALGLAHRYGVVHRDIKPGNILLDDDGNAYLADFGIAQIVSNAQPDTDDMMMGMGSPAYAAPEQIIGNVTTPESDIYSLGIILYELLTGQHPFPDLEDLSMTELNSLRATGTMPTILDKRLDVTRALNDVLQKATAINPRDRFQDAMAFARAFHNASGSAGRMYASAPIVDSNATIPNPYKGLRAFQETDAPNFFGRDALVERLISRMREDSPFARFLAVVGPSGSGKSSVVRAGLIPALRDGAVDGAENWYYDQVIPGEQPFSEIENAIVGLAVDEPSNLMEQLLRDDDGLLDAVNTVLP